MDKEDHGTGLIKVLSQAVGGAKEPLAAFIFVFVLMYGLLILLGKFDGKFADFIMVFGMSLVAVFLYPFVRKYTRNSEESEGPSSQLAVTDKNAKIESLERQVQLLEEKLSMSEKARNWEKYDEKIDIRSIDTDLDVPDRFKDFDNYYSELIFHASINERGDYSGNYVRNGSRKSAGTTDHLLFRVGASSAVPTANHLKVLVRDLLTGKKLNTTVEEDDWTSKVYKIHFAKPLMKGQEFSIEISFTWPNCITMPRDTDTINLSMFAGGIGKMRHELTLDQDLFGLKLYKIDGNNVERTDVDLNLSEVEGRHHVSYEVLHPNSDGYVLAFSLPVKDQAA